MYAFLPWGCRITKAKGDRAGLNTRSGGSLAGVSGSNGDVNDVCNSRPFARHMWLFGCIQDRPLMHY